MLKKDRKVKKAGKIT